MGFILLDTSVASFLHPKKRYSAALNYYEPYIKDNRAALSFQSVAELWQWAEKYKWGETNRAELNSFIHQFLLIPFEIQLAKVWAQVMNSSCIEGRRFETGDCWIAAAAVLYNSLY